ncbi:hypothetical protein [Geminocystis sp. NIES-3709]|uniref:hypothetical protein n=1 Tax=Geminocystis sp. NIES-3709 TaxID=1617448 RepID=UPI0005FCB47F|nr:hypothetical protein [Geminocystis sp. NIES-3709]BAQ65499.1 hypothetical protein GM3709_2264 [Geminocystis sp. NIES-3709]
MLVNLYQNWENTLIEVAELFGFEFEKIGVTLNDFGQLQNSYRILDLSFARKSDLDNFIVKNSIYSSQYTRATVLYSLYSCGYLTVVDIQYPTYQDWKNKYPNMTLYHQLPRKWFPLLTFDCSNWKAMSKKDNKRKKDDFINEGVERLEFLSSNFENIKNKYQ